MSDREARSPTHDKHLNLHKPITQGRFRAAVVGSGAEKHVDTSVRGDFVSWLDPSETVGRSQEHKQRHQDSPLGQNFPPEGDESVRA